MSKKANESGSLVLLRDLTDTILDPWIRYAHVMLPAWGRISLGR